MPHSLTRLARTLGAALVLAGGTTLAARAAMPTTIPASGTTPAIPAVMARPSATTGPFPAVVVLHGCEGYRDRLATIADGLARRGMIAVAIDSFAPRGVKSACNDPSGSRYEAEYARATLAWLRTQPGVDPDHLALLGYSMGGVAIMDVVAPRRAEAAPAGLAAAVAYYPACRNRAAANLTVPLAILDGEADDWTPAAPCAALAAAATTAGKTLALTTYPGATHAFNVPAKDRTAYGHVMRYDAAAAADAQTRMLAFLQKYLTAK